MNIERIKNELLDAIRLHPHHECTAMQRRSLYHSFKDTTSVRWLELVTARKVIPIYESQIPTKFVEEFRADRKKLALERLHLEKKLDERGLRFFDEELIEAQVLMRHMVEMAEGVLRGTFPLVDAGFLANNYYHDGFPRWFWASDNYGLPYSVECAYYAAKSAISTACGRDPLFRVGRVKRSGNAYVMGDFEQDDTDLEWRDSRAMTDLELTHAYSGDAAAYAMVAFAAEPTADFKQAKQEEVLSPELKLTFWEWWLTQAVPEALRLATGD